MPRIGTFRKKTDRPSSDANPRGGCPDDWIEVLKWQNDNGHVVGIDYYVAPGSYREDGTVYTHKEYHLFSGTSEDTVEGMSVSGSRAEARAEAIALMRDVTEGAR